MTAEGSSLLRMTNDLPVESEWVEFKQNFNDPESIGEYVSAIANGAKLVGRPQGFIVWGVEDGTRQIVGTSFDPTKTVKGNQGIENWLSTQLQPQVLFRFVVEVVDGKRIVVLEVAAAENSPVQFKGTSYVRVGSHKKRLADHPAIERELWRRMENVSAEESIEVGGVSASEVLILLNIDTYCGLIGTPIPTTDEGKISLLVSEQMISDDGRGAWNIAKFAALAIGRDLSRFPRVGRKALRVVEYADHTRLRGMREREFNEGYLLGLEAAVAHLVDRLPQIEVLDPVRHVEYAYPVVALRELLINTLVHQDLWVRGAGPMIEVFSNRIEFTNPGAPLVDTDRFLDSPPKSRNEKLAALTRRAGFCEERGTGVDKIVAEVELAHLPAPKFEARIDNTIVTLYGPRPFDEMSREDRSRAVYLHACLQYVNGLEISNATIRERFQVTDPSKVSRLLNDGVKAGRLRLLDSEVGFKSRRYVPYWA
jgi:ATP-dependent DNA helicase RecG